MDSWDDRTVEEANLFNPAFCAMLLGKASKEYAKKGHGQLPFPLSFVILPLVLHPRTRAALPYSTVTSLPSWTQDHRADLVELGLHARVLLPYTREAIMFGLGSKSLAIDASGNMHVGPKYVTPTEKKTELFTAEVRDCLDRAGFVGRWFSAAGDAATIFSTLGVKP